MNELSVRYRDSSGNEVRLTKEDVVKYISTDSAVTEKEVFAFLNLCKFLKLNPFLKEIYLIKYKGAPATFVVSYQTLLKRAEKSGDFDGYDVTVEGEVPDLTATAVVYRKSKSHPFKAVVRYKEAVKTVIDRKSGKERPNSAWARMPRWMLRKVALARALKEAFPNAVGSLPVDAKENVNIEKPMSDAEIKEGLSALYGGAPDTVEVPERGVLKNKPAGNKPLEALRGNLPS